MKLRAIPKLFNAVFQTYLLVCCVLSANAANATTTADTIPAPLTTTAGDPINGRAIVSNRNVGLCLLCHSAAFADQAAPSNLAPTLDGIGARYNAAQLRLRIVDSRRLNAASIMPAYYRVEGLTRVSAALQGKPILNAQQIEDVVAFLVTLK
jgi:L-cysteine S-thiosulfotransferase